MMNRWFWIRVLAVLPLGTASMVNAADLTITLTSVKSETGAIRLVLYDSEATFRKTPVRALSMAATTGDMLIKISDLSAGKYAVMLFQDSNGNEELDTNLLGLPREPWGASVGRKPVFGPPDWEGTCFTLPEPGAQIPIALR